MVSSESVLTILLVSIFLLAAFSTVFLKRAHATIDKQNERLCDSNRDLMEALMTSSDTWRENERMKLDYKFGEVQLERARASNRPEPRRPDGEPKSPPGTVHVEVGDDQVGGP